MSINEFEKTILDIISKKSGIKAKDIALEIGCDKGDVNAALYGVLSVFCYQDSSYKWFLNKQDEKENKTESNVSFDKELSNLCKYYLNCLSIEENNGISAFLTSNYALDYAELSGFSIDSHDEKIPRLIRKINAGKNLTANVGYPIAIIKKYSSHTDKEYLKIAPVFLFPVEITGGAVSVASIPHVNMEIIKQYSSKDINIQAFDLIDLENMLGLNTFDADIDIDEMVARLQAHRDWQWKEPLDPSTICNIPCVDTLTQEGIYNRAIFIVTERSPYTIGLESELLKLSQLDESAYKGSALFDWVHHNFSVSNNEKIDASHLLEVLPMNTEQEQAIEHSLNNKLTIVTGPPGTGKSQVVTNLLINAAWNGKSVLFTSKNNKAVDVVETRINALGRRPIMLRIGGNQHAYHLSELIFDLLSCIADQNDQQEYQHYRSIYIDKLEAYKKLKTKKETIINLRNHADHMEQKVCELRDQWGKWFASITISDSDRFESIYRKYCFAYKIWDSSKNSFFGKLFWFLIKKAKTAEIDKYLSQLNGWFRKYDLPIFADNSDYLNVKTHQKNCAGADQLIYALQTISEYCEALDDLLNAPTLENIDLEQIKIKTDLANVAKKLWNNWLITRPLKIDAACREEMNSYISSMRLIGDIDISDYPEIKKSFNHLQEKMTRFLPCWAVTSLSAKGKIPFLPGIFDLVVIDEASQCDIASALPMLYRAKRAVIIGDPKQLSHISTISQKQDLVLTKKYDIPIGRAYSVNSLYAIANSLSDPSQIFQLKDHHRSCKEIIEFSNSEFYDGKLRVATNYDKLKCPANVTAGIRWVDVVGKTTRPSNGSAYNKIETDTLVKEIKRLVVDNGYEGSVGVVTPFKAQAEQISKTIEAMSEFRVALQKNDFLVDTVHKFQGDERDLIFFSPVISQGTNNNALGFLKNTGNLFNVAITRARAVLIVVGDLSYCEKCGVPYMEHFVKYFKQINLRQEQEINHSETYPKERIYPKVANPEQVSDWEKLFYTALFDQGIKTIPQYPADKYKLDLAIIDGKRMLDIEIDGEMYHKDWNGELSYRDQLRNQRLFEIGWDVKRFWVYQIRDDLQSCIDDVKKWCAKK